MDGIDPGHLLRRFYGRDIQVDDHRILPTADQDATERLVPAGIDLLMGHKRRHVDEIAGSCLRHELQAITPPHPRSPADDVDHALEIAMVMGAGFRVGMNRDRASPQLAGPRGRVGESRRSRHAGRLGSIQIQRRTGDDADTVVTPVLVGDIAHVRDSSKNRLNCAG